MNRHGDQSHPVRNSFFVMLALTVSSSCTQSIQSNNVDITSTLASIDAGRLRADMMVLAADNMEGREAGTQGHRRAAEYVAERFKEIGLQPMGDDGTFFQNIDFLESRILPRTASMSLHRDGLDFELKDGEDFIRSGGFGESVETIAAPVVFVGFGIRAPAYDHDDYSGVDVKGKLVVALSGAPPSFAANERAYYSSNTGKQALAVELGAIGIATVRTPVDRKRLPWQRILEAAARPAMRWVESDETPHDGHPELIGNVSLSETGANKLFELIDVDLEQLIQRHLDGASASFEFGLSATLGRNSAHRRVSSQNVVALLPGSDTVLSHEYVIFTAHLDHLGTRIVDDNNIIYNGAYDNAAGVATVLEVARALSVNSPAPRRPILFAAVTAEEKGLRGSDYLANHPPVPIKNIIANLNLDMPYLGFPLRDVEGFGVEHSTLQLVLAGAAKQLGLELTPDSRPELVRLIRSDQFSFVKQGVPGLNLKPGTQSSTAAIDGPTLVNGFLRQHYHQPSDNVALPFDDTGARQFAQIALLLGIRVAGDDQRPRWYEGDFFGDRFAKREPKAKR